jgi:hypothetical protein
MNERICIRSHPLARFVSPSAPITSLPRVLFVHLHRSLVSIFLIISTSFPCLLCLVLTQKLFPFQPSCLKIPILRFNNSTDWSVLRPFSFSSRLIRVKAATRPMDIAKMGSRDLERRVIRLNSRRIERLRTTTLVKNGRGLRETSNKGRRRERRIPGNYVLVCHGFFGEWRVGMERNGLARGSRSLSLGTDVFRRDLAQDWTLTCTQVVDQSESNVV